MRTVNVIELMVTAKCSLDCELCSHGGFRKMYPNYSMTMEDIERLIFISKKSGYQYNYINLCGGEPTIWPHLEEALELLKNVLKTKVILFTNGARLERLSERGWDNIEKVWLSLYPGIYPSLAPFEQMKAKYGDKLKIDYKPEFTIIPKKGYPGTLPAKCHCPHPLIVGDTAFICTHIMSGGYALGESVFDYPERFAKVKKGFLEHFDGTDKFNFKFCTGCNSNTKLNGLGQVPHNAHGGGWMKRDANPVIQPAI